VAAEVALAIEGPGAFGSQSASRALGAAPDALEARLRLVEQPKREKKR